MPQDLRPQAIMLPRPLAPNLPPRFDTHAFIRQTFAPILGVPLVHTYAEMNQYFVAPSGDDTLYFPALSPWASEERYLWFIAGGDVKGPFQLGEQVGSYRDRPEAVKFGYVRDPDSIPTPTPAAKAEFERERMSFVMEMRAKVLRLTELMELSARKGLDSAQQAELDALKAELT